MSHSWRAADGPVHIGRARGDYTSPMDQQNGSYRIGDPSASVGDASNEKLEKLKEFFGDPTRAPQQGRDYFEQEYHDYPEAFSKFYGSGNDDGSFTKNGYLSRVLIEKTRASDMWPLAIAPLYEHKGGLVMEWDMMKFNRHMLDREPEESTPRLLTSTRTSGSTSMVRFGIALMLESTFAGTPAGASMYINNIEQIRIATVETMAYGVVVAILEHQPYSARDAVIGGAPPISGSRTRNDMDRLMKDEVAMFGMINKEPEAIASIISQCDRVMTERQVDAEANFTILPRGVGQYIDGTAFDKYYLTGNASGVGEKLRLGPAMVESRTFSMGEHTAGHDPVFRHQTIGGFATLDDSKLRGAYLSDYRTDHLDSAGYDEDADEMSHLQYSNHYQYAGLWNFSLTSEHPPLTELIGLPTMDDFQCYTWGQLNRQTMKRPDDAIQRIYELPTEKRPDFLRALKLLPVGDRRTNEASTGDNYNPNLFRSMNDTATEWDVQFSIDTRREIQERQRRGATAPGDEVARFEADDAYRRTQPATNGYQYGAPRTADNGGDRFCEDDYEQVPMQDGNSSDEDYDDGAPAPLRPLERVVDTRARTVAVYDKQVAKVFRLRRAAHAVAAQPLGFASSTATKQREIDTHAGDARAATGTKETQAALLAHACVVASCPTEIVGVPVPYHTVASFVASHVHIITHDLRALSLEQRCALMVGLRDATRQACHIGIGAPDIISVTSARDIGDAMRVCKEYKIVAGVADIVDVRMFHQNIISQIIASFVPSYAAYQTIACVRDIRNPTPLERRVARANNNLAAIASETSASDLAVGWWNVGATPDVAPPQSEDGQVRLIASLCEQDAKQATIALEHDAFAITLTAKHSVYFDVSEYTYGVVRGVAGAIATPAPAAGGIAAPAAARANATLSSSTPYVLGTSEKLHRDRRDAFVWSYMLSLLNGGHITVTNPTAAAATNDTFARVNGTNAAGADIFARLRRHMLHCDVRSLLPTQAHLYEEHQRCLRQLRVIVEKSQFFACVPKTNAFDPFADADSINSCLLVQENVESMIDSITRLSAGGVSNLSPLTPAEQAVLEIVEDGSLLAAINVYTIKMQTNVTISQTELDAFDAAVTRVRLACSIKDAVFTTRNQKRRTDIFAAWLLATYGEVIASEPSTLTDARNGASELFQLLDDDAVASASPRRPAAASAGAASLGAEWTLQSVRDLIDRASLVSGEFWRFCVDNNIPLGFGLTLWRPSKTYNMGSLVRLTAGANGAARTPYQNPNFMMADNAAQKTIYGHFTVYFKTIVLFPEKIVIAKNVYCNDYIGGNGVQVWDPLNMDHLAAYRDGDLSCDVFVTVFAMRDAGRNRTSWRSMTGVMPKSLGVTPDVNELVYYPGCNAVTSFWGWRTDAREYADTVRYRATATDAAERKFNVLCMQELQLRYDASTKKFSELTRDCGHWSDRVYPGCGSVRRGKKRIFELPFYAQTKSIGLA